VIPVGPTEKQLKQYGLMMAGVLSFFTILFLYKAWHTAAMALAVWVLFFLTLGLLAPARLAPVYRVWMKFGEVVGNFNFKLILGLMYFVVFTPMRILAGFFRPDPLTRKMEPEKKTYWHDCEPRSSDPKRFEKQF
jgi:ABC-type polysaccharide/polyol phosphate export permease